MNLADYFKHASGTGVLATCDPGHEVDVAIYAKPYVADENTVIFVMKERLSHQNLLSNPQAAYLFMEDGRNDKGVRLYLTMIREEKNQTAIKAMQKKQPCMFPAEDDSEKFMVSFQIDRVRSLIGDGPLDL